MIGRRAWDGRALSDCYQRVKGDWRRMNRLFRLVGSAKDKGQADFVQSHWFLANSSHSIKNKLLLKRNLILEIGEKFASAISIALPKGEFR